MSITPDIIANVRQLLEAAKPLPVLDKVDVRKKGVSATFKSEPAELTYERAEAINNLLLMAFSSGELLDEIERLQVLCAAVPVITVIAFKPNGKMYSVERSLLRRQHRGHAGLQDTITANDPAVHSYSPMGNFGPGFIYSIHVEYPPEQDGFCTFLLDRTEARS